MFALLPLLFAAPPDVAEPAEVVSAPAARAEAEDLATFATLLTDAVAPLYPGAELAPVRSAALSGGDAVFLMDLPPLRPDDPAAVGGPARDPEGCPFAGKSAWDRARLRTTETFERASCVECHARLDGAKYRWRETAAPRRTLAEAFAATEPPADPAAGAPTRAELFGAIRDVLTEYGGHLRKMSAGGRISVAVTLGDVFEGAAARETVHRLTAQDVSLIETAEAEASLFESRGEYGAAKSAMIQAVRRLTYGLETVPPDTGGPRRTRDVARGRLWGRQMDPRLAKETARLLRRVERLHGQTLDAGRSEGEPAGFYGRIADGVEAAAGPPPLPARLTVTIEFGDDPVTPTVLTRFVDPHAG